MRIEHRLIDAPDLVLNVILKVFKRLKIMLNVYSIQLASDLRQVGGFLRFPPPIKLTATIYLTYC